MLDLWRRAGVLGGVTDTHAGLSRLLATDPAALLLARSDAIVIGSLIAAWDGWRGSFYRLAVDPGRRREGIATALLREGERRLLELGAVRLTAIVADPDGRRFVYIQHSPTFRFPDIITVEFVPLGPYRSSIAIYSRSRYGHYDFGKNRKRVGKWLALLEKVAQPAIGRRAGAE